MLYYRIFNCKYVFVIYYLQYICSYVPSCEQNWMMSIGRSLAPVSLLLEAKVEAEVLLCVVGI